MPSMISVAMKPGRTALQRTFTGPYSSAALRIISSMAALATGYAPKYGCVTCPAIDDMPTKDPPPAATMRGSACLRHSIVPSTFRWRTRVNSPTSCRWYGPIPPPPPAFATTPRSAPSARHASSTTRATSSSTVTSATTCRTLPPWRARSAMRDAAASSVDAVRPQIVTRAPCAASSAAHAAPMPVPPPVTITARSRSAPPSSVATASSRGSVRCLMFLAHGDPGIAAGLAARGRDLETGEVVRPARGVPLDPLLRRQAAMTEAHHGRVAVGPQRDLDGGGPRRHDVAALEPPRPHDALVRHDLDVLAQRDVAAGDVHAVAAAGASLRGRVDPHPRAHPVR